MRMKVSKYVTVMWEVFVVISRLRGKILKWLIQFRVRKQDKECVLFHFIVY